MLKPTINIQDSFLNQSRKDKIQIRVHLIDGSELVGKISAFDNFTVMLESEGDSIQHLIYKHSIASLSPKEKINLGGNP